MPILDIEIVASDSSRGLPAELTQTLAEAAAQVFDSPPGSVWVKLRIIPSEEYAENGGLPKDVYPVFVTVLKSRVQKGSELEVEIAQLTEAIARVLKRPKTNVHIFYQPDGAGRVAFGGKLVE